ncbi:MAG: hypothetical protein HFE68_04960 [Erysipelotrichaceae bacterium]|nr:hypothetical protein [Erysipelotrichaceae bacterium]
MNILHIDLETYSSVDLGKCGVYKYVESEDFEILLFAYGADSNNVKVVDLTREIIPPFIVSSILNPEIIKVAHNAVFERICLSKYLNVELSAQSWICTMVWSCLLGLPSSLGKVAKALSLLEQKDTKGKLLINYFCKPCAPTKANGGRTRNMPQDASEKWEQFIEYNRQDVKTEIAIYERLEKFPITQKEHELWCLDQRINDTGIRIDTDLVNQILDFSKKYSEDLQEECLQITGGIAISRIAKLKEWIGEVEGKEISDLTKEGVKTLLGDDTLHQETRRVLEIRQETGKTSITKYDAIARAVCKDGRLRGTLQFYGGARTGRWAGRIFQPQNLPRNTFDDVDGARATILAGDIDMVDLLYDTYNNTFSSLIRTMVIPSSGCLFAVADYSAIEARVTAWFCDERWRQSVFAGDGKIYEASASQMFHVPIEQITKGSDLRKKGKVAELALGYGGGVSALERMGGAAMGLSQEEMEEIKTKWRAASPRIAKMWYSVFRAAEEAVKARKRTDVAHGMYYWYKSGILFAHLPSGRDIAYARPSIKRGTFGKELEYDGSSAEKDEDGHLKYSGGWGRVSAWGGKLFENLIQAIARDCLAEAMMCLYKEKGYRIVMHVHDEVIVEVPQENAEQHLQEIEEIMGREIPWAPGLYLTADGFISEYYRKD